MKGDPGSEMKRSPQRAMLAKDKPNSSVGQSHYAEHPMTPARLLPSTDLVTVDEEWENSHVRTLTEWAHKQMMDVLEFPEPTTPEDEQFLWNISYLAGAMAWAAEKRLPNADWKARYFMSAYGLKDPRNFLPQMLQYLKEMPAGPERKQVDNILRGCLEDRDKWQIPIELVSALFERLYKKMEGEEQAQAKEQARKKWMFGR